MPLTLPFFLINDVPDDEAKMATVVFIENSGVADPSKTQTPPQFTYTAWQFLNPASGSSQAFEYVSELSVTAKIVPATDQDDTGEEPSPAAQYIPSEPRTVSAGQRWQVSAKQVSRTGQTQYLLKLDHAGTTQGSTVEIVNPLALEPDLALELHWYFGANRMGITTGVAQGQAASLQVGSRLFFKPVIPGKEDWLEKQWASDDVLKNTTPYVPPITAEEIQIRFLVKPKDPPQPTDGDMPAADPDPVESGRIYEFNPPGG